MTRGEAVDEGEVVELACAAAELGEVVVEVVHAAGVGAEKDPVGSEIPAYGRCIDAVEKVVEILAGCVACKREVVSRVGEALGGGWCEWDEGGGKLPVEGDGPSAKADEGVDVAEIST